MTRYLEAFSWSRGVGRFLMEQVRERPLLHVCSGRSQWLDVTLEAPVTVDRFELADVRADWSALPFGSDSFAAVFADPPWDAAYKSQVAGFMKSALRVAPVVYVMAPWLYGARRARITKCFFRQLPGVNSVVSIIRYERARG